MKIIFLTILCCTLSAQADDTNITVKVFEKRDSADKIKFRVETTYRGKEKILDVWSRPNPLGVMMVTARGYSVNGKLVMVEGDEDHDGSFETIVIYHPNSDALEVFTRQADGAVKPADAATVKKQKKLHAEISATIDKIFLEDKK